MGQVQDVLQSPGESSGEGAKESGPHAHDFDVQKQIHQQIRNDPDYDDWEYGTEPLPHEAWVGKAQQASAAAGADDNASPPA